MGARALSSVAHGTFYSRSSDLTACLASYRAQTFAAITKRCPTKSTWSIDLAYLLHGFGIDAKYFTITWGANESYKSIEYYKQNLDSDASRVNELFEMAATRGLHVEMRSVGMDEILKTVTTKPSGPRVWSSVLFPDAPGCIFGLGVQGCMNAERDAVGGGKNWCPH